MWERSGSLQIPSCPQTRSHIVRKPHIPRVSSDPCGCLRWPSQIITRPEKLVGLKEIFATHNCQGMTCLSVMGCGRQKGYLPEMNFTGDDINLLPKIMVFVVVEDDQIEEILADIATAIGTGKNGDGKVFVTEVLDAMRIRTNERGNDALM